MSRNGFTLIEILTALAILLGGGTALWWGLRTGFVSDQRLYQRQMADEALVSEAERLQGGPQAEVGDTSYAIPQGGVKILMVRRIVLDSARRETLYDPLLINDQLRQAWRERPLEVLLQAWFTTENSDPENTESSPAAASAPVDTTRLFLVLPNYQWY